MDDPPGTTHDLVVGGEADWTYGPWRFGQPNPIPVARATHLAKGGYMVVLPRVGTPGGIVQVSVYDYTAVGAFCQPVSWGPQGADEAIEVACFNRSGQRADAPFATLFLAGNGGQWSLGGARGFVYAASPTARSYTPGPLSESNAGVVTRTGTGRYTVALAGGAETAQVSAVGGQARHCGLTGLTATTAAVACTAADGIPAAAATATWSGATTTASKTTPPSISHASPAPAPPPTTASTSPT